MQERRLAPRPKARQIRSQGQRPNDAFRPRQSAGPQLLPLRGNPHARSSDTRTIARARARDLLGIIEDRYDAGSLMITSQIPIDRWHDMISVPTLADAILDRVIHNAYRIDLLGESLRKRRSSS
ncbi:MAG: hypothetical protein FJX45_17965 [Alphaproteobacteria bacterium]|nr:hypothetical protein [Alphaproteobacteria bacterium]